jgi:hypothetical protein
MAQTRQKRPQVQRTKAKRCGVALPALCRAVGLPEPEAEYRFHPTRKWRIDWYWQGPKVGLEIDGGIWTGGRHTRGAGWLKDAEKLNAAAAAGIRMLRATPSQVASGEILTLLETVLRSPNTC